MTKFQITNIQLRNDRGSFLGHADDITVVAKSADIEDVAEAVAGVIGNDNASFTWEAVA